MTLNPFEIGPEDFLILFAGLLILVAIIGLIIPAKLRPFGRDKSITDPDELAILTAGKPRYADSVVANMLSARSLLMITKDSFSVVSVDRANSQAEQSVLKLPTPIKWTSIAKTLNEFAAPIERRLADAGQIMDRDELRSIRFWAVLPYLALITFGGMRLIIGIQHGRPVGFLILLMVATAIFALIRYFSIDRRTESGRAVAKAAQTRHDRLKRAPTGEETALAVALFGTGVLAASPLNDFHRLRSSDGGGTSSSDSSGGCGGGGCGGGGCGG